MGGNRSKERDRKSELVFWSTYQVIEWDRTTRIRFLIFEKQVELPQIELKYKTCLGYVPISSSASRPLGAVYIYILLSEVEQQQRLSRNGDREAIVVGAGLCDIEGERANIAYAPHFIFAFRKHIRS